LSASSV